MNALLGDRGNSQRLVIGYCREDESCSDEFKAIINDLYQDTEFKIITDSSFPVDLANSGLGKLILEVVKFRVRVIVLCSSESISSDMRLCLDLLAKNFDTSVVIWR